jgi:hypothetical protein
MEVPNFRVIIDWCDQGQIEIKKLQTLAMVYYTHSSNNEYLIQKPGNKEGCCLILL